jgi:hypothetical protein
VVDSILESVDRADDIAFYGVAAIERDKEAVNDRCGVCLRNWKTRKTMLGAVGAHAVRSTIHLKTLTLLVGQSAAWTAVRTFWSHSWNKKMLCRSRAMKSIFWQIFLDRL